MKRRFTELPDRKVEWRVFTDDDVLLASRVAPNEKKAWCESADQMKLLARGKHLNAPGKKHK